MALILALPAVRPAARAGAQVPAAPWPAAWAWQGTSLGAGMGEAQAMVLVDDTLLLRFAARDDADKEPRILAIDARSGQRRLGPTPITEVISGQRSWVRALGSQSGFWLVDRAGRIWLGPSYHDGRRWTVLAKGGAVGGTAQLAYASDGLLDPDGQVWVPYRLDRNGCQEPGACTELGLQAFGPEGPRQRVLDLGDPGAEPSLGVMAFALLQAPGAGWALGPRWALLPPGSAALTYPYLGEPEPGTLRHAGYASAAWWGIDASPQAALWVELQEPAGPRELPLLIRWDAADRSWLSEPLGGCPLLRGTGPRRITAGTEAGRDGALLRWLASNQGEVAAQWDGRWWSWTSAEVGLGSGPIRGLAFHPTGGAWVSAEGGVRRFGPALERPPGRLLLPGLWR